MDMPPVKGERLAMNLLTSKSDIAVEKLAAPRYGKPFIDFLVNLSSQKELLTFCLMVLTPGVIFMEHFVLPNHIGPSLYIFLLICFCMLFQSQGYIVFIASTFAVLRYMSYSDNFSEHTWWMLGSILIFYNVLGLFTQSLVKILQSAQATELQSIYSLLQTIQMRDHYTAQHSRNVAEKSVWIAQELNMYQDFQQNLYIAGLLHDIGKIAIPDAILTKPDRLTLTEFVEIKKHPQLGMDLLQHAPIMRHQTIRDAILYHHERYDGNGYPSGLRGEEIPLSARIMAIADTYDAMTTNRVYQRKRSPEEAMRVIRENAGTQFDPKLVAAFAKLMDEKVPELRKVVSLHS